MREAVIVDAVRTPVGRYAGALKDVRPDDLAARCISEIVRRNNVNPEMVEDIIFGCGKSLIFADLAASDRQGSRDSRG